MVRVPVVDDEETIRELLRSCLQREGFEVEGATSLLSARTGSLRTESPTGAGPAPPTSPWWRTARRTVTVRRPDAPPAPPSASDVLEAEDRLPAL